MAADLNCTIDELMADEQLRQNVDVQRYVTDTVGIPTLTDIMSELAKPGRDPRDSFEVFAFAEDVTSMQDLEPGMQLPGIVTNVTRFGAFVDVGVHQDGLVHISEMADRFIKDPAEVTKVQQKVMVTVLEVDQDRKRISLSMRSGKKTRQRDRSKAVNRPVATPKPKSKQRKPKANTPFHNPLAQALEQLKRK
jgi:uncharacterized protein